MDELTYYWVVEHAASRPFPIFVQSVGGYAVCNPRHAKMFLQRDEARTWALEHGYGSPWVVRCFGLVSDKE